MPEISFGIAPAFASLVRNLRDERFYFHGDYRQFTIESPKTGYADFDARYTKVDRFKLRLSSPGKSVIHWWIILNAESPEDPPDFIFHETSFQPPISSLKALVNWDSRNERALCGVVLDLLECLKSYQIENLPRFSRYSIEQCLKTERVSKKHTSLSVNKTENTVTFYVRLNVPEFPEDLYADIEFTENLGSPVTSTSKASLTKVALSDALNKLIGPISQTYDESLLTSMARIAESIDTKVREAESHLCSRRKLLAELLNLQGASLLEVDVAGFERIDLLIKHDEVHIQVTIELPKNRLLAENVSMTARDIYRLGRDRDRTISFRLTEGTYLQMAGQLLRRVDDLSLEVASKYFEASSALEDSTDTADH